MLSGATDCGSVVRHNMVAEEDDSKIAHILAARKQKKTKELDPRDSL